MKNILLKLKGDDGSQQQPPTEEGKETQQPQTQSQSQQESADEIRRKRLARFGAAPSSPTTTTTTTTTTATTTTTTSSSPANANATPTNYSTLSTPSKMEIDSTSTSTSTSTPKCTAPKTPATSATTTTQVSSPSRTPVSSNANNNNSNNNNNANLNTPPKTTTPTASNSLSPSSNVYDPSKHVEWEEYLVEKILHITIAPSHSTQNIFYLESFSSELIQEGSSLHPLDKVMFDRLIMARLSVNSPQAPLEYLVATYHRLHDEMRKPANKGREERISLIKTSIQLILSYSTLVLLLPEAFPKTSTSTAQQIVTLLEKDNEIGVSGGFLDQISETFTSRDDLVQVFGSVFKLLSDKIRDAGLLGTFVPHINSFAILLSNQKIAYGMIINPYWNPGAQHAWDGKLIEKQSILGPFFSLSCLPDYPAVGEQYFIGASTMSPQAISNAIESLRSVLNSYHDVLHRLIGNTLRVTRDHREAVLAWIASVLEKNSSRGKMNFDRLTTSTDGFLLNLCYEMLQLCGPFLDPSKVDSIDSGYFVANSRIDLSKDTKLAATSDETASWIDKRNPSRAQNWRVQQQLQQGSLTHNEENAALSPLTTSPSQSSSSSSSGDTSKPANNFITECFFLTIRALHLGLLKTLNRFNQLLKALHEVTKAKKKLEESKGSWLGTPAAPENERQLEEVNKQIDTLHAHRYAVEAQMLNPKFTELALRFYSLVTVWIVKLATGGKNVLPLPTPPPMVFATLPEHCVEDVTDFILFLSRIPRGLNAMDVNSLNDLMSFLVVFLYSSDYVKNPYLRAKLVEVMAALANRGSDHGDMLVFESNQLACTHLVPGLMRFYVDIEFTGSHTQFYDKFNIRYYVSSLMKHLWSIPVFRSSIVTESGNKDRFLKFVNMLLNDAIYLLDEVLSKLEEIRGNQIAFQDENWVRNTPAEQRQERETMHHRIEGMTSSFMQLANSTLDMLHYLSEDPFLVKQFTQQELIDRLASMLDYFLVKIAGPACRNLKVQNPDKYHFAPKTLLGTMCDLYVNFGGQSAFPVAVAKDGRSYSEELFNRAASIIEREGIRPPDILSRFISVAEAARVASLEQQDVEMELGEIPDEFLDPILSTLMIDPVILPSSGQTVDRSTITRHLLSDPSDPFNRSPLTPDMLKPNVELKQKIEEFVKSKKAK